MPKDYRADPRPASHIPRTVSSVFVPVKGMFWKPFFGRDVLAILPAGAGKFPIVGWHVEERELKIMRQPLGIPLRRIPKLGGQTLWQEDRISRKEEFALGQYVGFYLNFLAELSKGPTTHPPQDQIAGSKLARAWEEAACPKCSA